VKYEVKRACGHTETIQLFGTYKNRMIRYAWAQQQPCRECCLAERRQEEKALAEELGLPELAGTEKQVAWANSLRLDWAKPLYDKLDYWRQRGVGEAVLAQCKQAIVEVLSSRTDAKWWIDHRHELGALLRPELENLLVAINADSEG